MKKRKFADGGFTPGVIGDDLPEFGTMPGGVQGGTARGGLDQINQGSNAVSSALDQVSGSLKQAGEAIGGGGGGGPFPTGPMVGPYQTQQYKELFSKAFQPSNPSIATTSPGVTMKKGGKVKGYAKGGSVSSASRRGDGIAQRGKTKGRMV